MLYKKKKKKNYLKQCFVGILLYPKSSGYFFILNRHIYAHGQSISYRILYIIQLNKCLYTSLNYGGKYCFVSCKFKFKS